MFSLNLRKMKHPTEFGIMLFPDGGPTKHLSCRDFYGGMSPLNNPPRLTEACSEAKTRMTLKELSQGKGVQVNPQDWISSGTWLAIRSSQRHGLKQGAKLCMKMQNFCREYELCAMPSTKYHDKGGNYMRFCLEKVPSKSFEHNYQRQSIVNF